MTFNPKEQAKSLAAHKSDGPKCPESSAFQLTVLPPVSQKRDGTSAIFELASEHEQASAPSPSQRPDASVCARCAQSGPTCCHSPDGVPLAPLTLSDISRISVHTGFKAAEFMVTREVDDEEREAWLDEEPSADAWICSEDGFRSLKIVDGRCFFLGSAGCTLPREVRPIECLRFPFAKRHGQVEADPVGHCLACDESKDIEELMLALQVDRAELASLEERLARAAQRQREKREREKREAGKEKEG